MDFTLTPEQLQMRDSIRRYLGDQYRFADRLAAAREGAGWRPDVWRTLAGLGVTGVNAPEELGGSGGSVIDAMIIAEELGSALVLEPFAETVVVGTLALLADGGARARATVEAIAAGRHVCAFAWAEPSVRYALPAIATRAVREAGGWKLDGAKSAVSAAPWADSLLVVARTSGQPHDEGGLSLFLVEPDRPGVSLSAYPTIDGRRAADLTLNAVALPADALIGGEDDGLALASLLVEHGIAALAAEAVGIMSRMLEDTRSYLRQRQQFKQPLSEFQVVQHRLVDMFVQLEMARSASCLAMLKLDAPADERALAISSAKVTLGKAMRFVGQNAIQLHGGMGMTDDLAIGHGFKRLTFIEGEFGTIDHHIARHAMLRRAA